MGMRGQGAFGLAAVATVAMSTGASAADIDRMLGRWAAFDLSECANADDSEVAPLFIRQQDGETLLGTYAWLCGVREWKKEGDFLVGEAKACGQEGDAETFDRNFRIGLDAQDRLVMVEGEAQYTYQRCPAAQ